MTIRELKVNPVKLHQYFRTSVGEVEGTALSTGSTVAEKQDITIFNVTSLVI